MHPLCIIIQILWTQLDTKTIPRHFRHRTFSGIAFFSRVTWKVQHKNYSERESTREHLCKYRACEIVSLFFDLLQLSFQKASSKLRSARVSSPHFQSKLSLSLCFYNFLYSFDKLPFPFSRTFFFSLLKFFLPLNIFATSDRQPFTVEERERERK